VAHGEAATHGGGEIGQLREELDERLIHRPDLSRGERDPHERRHHALAHRAQVVLRVPVEDDVPEGQAPPLVLSGEVFTTPPSHNR